LSNKWISTLDKSMMIQFVAVFSIVSTMERRVLYRFYSVSLVLVAHVIVVVTNNIFNFITFRFLYISPHNFCSVTTISRASLSYNRKSILILFRFPSIRIIVLWLKICMPSFATWLCNQFWHCHVTASVVDVASRYFLNDFACTLNTISFAITCSGCNIVYNRGVLNYACLLGMMDVKPERVYCGTWIILPIAEHNIQIV
jgi:hypothetical protein